MNKETIDKIKELKEKGKTQKQISKELNINYNTVRYYYSEEQRKSIIESSKNWRNKNPNKFNREKYNEYQKNYQNNYYHSKDNHERLKEYQREYQRKRYNTLKEIKNKNEYKI